MPAIYRIRNTVDGRVYIGQAINFKKRKARHLWELRCGRHSNYHLQRAWAKYGEATFVFEMIVGGLAPKELTAEEQRQIDAHQASDPEHGYNIAPAAGSNLGLKYSVESRQRMSRAQKGRTFTDEARRRISEALKGRKRSQQAIEKQRAAMRLVAHTPEWNAAISAAHNARSSAQPLTAFGKSQYVNDWAREYGMNPATLRNRLYRSGMTLEKALTTPSQRGFRKDLHPSA